MKIANRTFLKGTNWALAGIMGLLGFASSCESADEYGTPYASYKVTGRVANQSGKPIPDIRIEIENDMLSSYIAITHTDSAGGYEIEKEMIGRTDKLRLIISDIDKEENGFYQNDTIQVAIEDKDYYDKGKGWNAGKARKEVNVILKEKTGTDE